MRRRSDRLFDRGLTIAALLTLCLAFAGCSGNAATGTVGARHGADDQLGFGVRMAQRGLWSEALFRFEKARQADPGNPRILNNMAVALEAAGRYDEALETYREAIRLSPGNRDLESNYAHFVDFYQSFQSDEVPTALGDGASEPDGSQEDSP
jgi:Tfp pilus assembly protein PilF